MALYHIHRPQGFSSVVGQEHIIQTLTNQIIGQKISHAYLFSGPRGVGKTTTARLLAKAINCQNRAKHSAEPCNECSSCYDIQAARAIDVIEIDAASHTGVDNVRENIIENAHFKPTVSPYKVFIIDEVHMLSTSAFNALLKIMEEPPKHVVFVLATTERHKVPDTITSRCQQFQFKRVPYKQLKSYIATIAKHEGVKVDEEVLDRIIQKSDGCARDAVSFLEQLMSLGTKTISADASSLILPIPAQEKMLHLLELILEKDIKETLTTLNVLRDEDGDMIYIADTLISLVRLLMIETIQASTDALSIDMSAEGRKKIQQLSKITTPEKILRLLDILLEKRRLISSSPLPQLPLEMAMVEWMHLPSVASFENLPQNTGPASQAMSKKENEPEKESKPSLTQRVKKLVTKEDVSVSEDTIRTGWQKVVTECGEHAPALTFILNMAVIIQVEGHRVTIAVPYTFHQDKLLEPKSRRSLEEMFSRHCGAKMQLDVTVNKSQQVGQSSPVSPELTALASALGGEIVG